MIIIRDGPRRHKHSVLSFIFITRIRQNITYHHVFIINLVIICSWNKNNFNKKKFVQIEKFLKLRELYPNDNYYKIYYYEIYLCKQNRKTGNSAFGDKRVLVIEINNDHRPRWVFIKINLFRVWKKSVPQFIG